MANLNKVMIIGNVTRDPEIKYTPQGKAVTDVSIAVNRSYKVGEEKREEVTYVDVTLWGRTAETAAEYCKKGRAVYIEGRLQLDSWEDKTSGQKRNKLRVVGEDYQLLDRRPGSARPLLFTAYEVVTTFAVPLLVPAAAFPLRLTERVLVLVEAPARLVKLPLAITPLVVPKAAPRFSV